MKNKLCIIYSIAPRYRESIFQAIDKEFDCDWYFSNTNNDIKQMDFSLLNNTYHYRIIGNMDKIYWECRILSLLFKHKYKTFLMLASSRSLTTYLFMPLCRLLKKKVYLWTHGWYGKERGLNAYIWKRIYRSVDGIFVYGNYARKLMIDQGIPSEKLHTIHNSLHYDEQIFIRESLSPSNIFKAYFNNDHPTIIFIGRLTKVKRLDLLLNALSSLKKKGEIYNLVFVGDGIEKANLQQLANILDLCDKIWFYGACYDEKKIAELIYNADLCVAPGNIGLTAMHSMVFGCPCISHNTFKWQMPEFEAIHPSITGDFFSMDSVESLAECISRWFESKKDKREEVRKSCFQEIDTQWNPYYQMNIIKKYLRFE